MNSRLLVDTFLQNRNLIRIKEVYMWDELNPYKEKINLRFSIMNANRKELIINTILKELSIINTHLKWRLVTFECFEGYILTPQDFIRIDTVVSRQNDLLYSSYNLDYILFKNVKELPYPLFKKEEFISNKSQKEFHEIINKTILDVAILSKHLEYIFR